MWGRHKKTQEGVSHFRDHPHYYTVVFNYRGICISSCLGKLFCSILNRRLLEHVQSLDILHKSQIGFLANNRTADHVLTLRTLIDKYVNCHQKKVYACFVDFRKAFESVWHDGPLYKLLKINIRGNFYNVIKSLYSNSPSSVRIGNSQTRSFQYARGVRQGCILSPLLFNLYDNDLAFSFNNILSDPFVLPNGNKLNSPFLCRQLNYVITIKSRIAKLPKRVILILQLLDAKNKLQENQDNDFSTMHKKV